jgi:hypothetical protein
MDARKEAFDGVSILPVVTTASRELLRSEKLFESKGVNPKVISAGGAE